MARLSMTKNHLEDPILLLQSGLELASADYGKDGEMGVVTDDETAMRPYSVTIEEIKIIGSRFLIETASASPAADCQGMVRSRIEQRWHELYVGQ